MNLDALITATQKQTGLDDFDSQDFVDRARSWLTCVASEARLSVAGHAIIENIITGWLVNRLVFVDDLKKHPEILDEVVREPIFVTGMPRTGTTKLQRVLAADPTVQSLPFWRILNIAPIRGAGSVQPDPRIALAAGYIDVLKQHYPDFLTAHPAFVDEPEEESFLMETDFQSLANCTRVRAPSYWRRIKDSHSRESIPYLKRALQYVQWQRGGAGKRPWVLKSPLHAGNLDALFETFPDALVVHTYRDPVVALPSNCRIVEVFRGMATDDIDLHELGAEQLSVWSDILQRHLQQRGRLDDKRIIDARYDDINNNVLAVIREIYRRRDRVIDPQTGQRINAWEANHPQHQFGQHRYSLERYGLTREGVQSAFAAYRERFGHQ